MHFEKALNNFIAEIKQSYRHEPMIKSMELSEDLYRRLEIELLEKSWKTLPVVGPRFIQFYSHGDVITFHKETKPKPEKSQRKIADLFEHDGDLYAVSNDGKLYSAPCWVYGVKATRPQQWHQWPDLPQD